MTAVDENLVSKLGSLKARADELQVTLRGYMAALRAARDAGASWPELRQAAGISIGSVRARYAAAVRGGEVHLKVDPPIPAQRREE